MISSMERAKEFMKRKALLSTIILFSTLSLGILIGTIITNGVRADKRVAPDATPLSIPAPKQLSSQFTQIAKSVEPAVVNIAVEMKMSPSRNRLRRAPGQDPFDDPFDFFRFFGRPDTPQDGFVQPVSGSGFIVDKKGYIVTNNHVVENAEKITVKLAGGEVYKNVKVVGSDNETDLAVLKIEPKADLTMARFGNSDSVNVGDWVLAVGSPFGLEQTLTAGIISAKNRDGIGKQFQQFLQTDAVINPGNSGGPLVNMDGEVVGINTLIATNSGVWQGYGFALPSNTAIKVYNQIIQRGRVERGSIGISHLGKAQTPVVLRSFGATDGKGVVVDDLKEGGPADKAGLKRGDVIRSINGKTISNWDDLVQTVAELPIDKTVTVKYLRDGQEHSAQLVIRDRCQVFPEACGETAENLNEDKDSAQAKFGLSIQNITPQIARQLNLKDSEGVVITRVESGSVADDVGLQRSDVILEINREAVRNLTDFRRIEGKLKSGDDVMFLYSRLDPRNGQRVTAYVGTTLP